jgi:hypothetical protein
MDWRSRLNQQAVTTGQSYSPATINSLRNRDLTSQYDTAGSFSGIVAPTNVSTDQQQAVGMNQSAEEPSYSVGGEYQPDQPVIGQPRGQNTALREKLGGQTSEYETRVAEYNTARERALQTKAATSIGSAGVGMALGTAIGTSAGGPAGAFIGFGAGLIGGTLLGGSGGGPGRDIENDYKIYTSALKLSDLVSSQEFQENPSAYSAQIANLYHDMHRTGLGGLTDENYGAGSSFSDQKIDKLLSDLGIGKDVLTPALGAEVPDYQGQDYKQWYDQQQNLYDQELMRRTGTTDPSAARTYADIYGGGQAEMMSDWDLLTGKKRVPYGQQAVYGTPEETYAGIAAGSEGAL